MAKPDGKCESPYLGDHRQQGPGRKLTDLSIFAPPVLALLALAPRTSLQDSARCTPLRCSPLASPTTSRFPRTFALTPLAFTAPGPIRQTLCCPPIRCPPSSCLR